MDDNKENNFINTNKCSISKIIIPHNTKLNNFKSNKYFSFDNNYNSMKDALTKYREKSKKSEKNDTINKTTPSNSSTVDISNINLTKQRFNKNNTIKLDKNIVNYTEERTKIKEFHKIQPKVIESFLLDDGEYLENFFESDLNEDDKKEDFIIGNKNLIYNNLSVEKYNKTIKMQKNKKKNKFKYNYYK